MVDPLRYEPDKADRPQSGCPFAQSANELAKSGTHGVALLGIVGRTTTFVASLVIIPILPVTRPRWAYSEVPYLPLQSSGFRRELCAGLSFRAGYSRIKAPQTRKCFKQPDVETLQGLGQGALELPGGFKLSMHVV